MHAYIYNTVHISSPPPPSLDGRVWTFLWRSLNTITTPAPHATTYHDTQMLHPPTATQLTDTHTQTHTHTHTQTHRRYSTLAYISFSILVLVLKYRYSPLNNKEAKIYDRLYCLVSIAKNLKLKHPLATTPKQRPQGSMA